jgi:hypothetical protein
MEHRALRYEVLLEALVKPAQLVAVALGSMVAQGHAQADTGALNSDAFNLSGAIDRPVAPIDTALEVAVGAGYIQGRGGAGSLGTVEDITGPGGNLELQLGLRAIPQLSLGLYGTLARFRNGDVFMDGSRVHGATAGIQAVWHGRTSRSVDPWIGLGAGWRGLWFTPSGAAASSIHGIELVRLQLGIDYRFTRWFAIAPILGVSATLFLREGADMAPELTEVRDNRLNLYGFTGILGRFDIGG